MEFNIALNTVIYIMIFIFPGILFRKFFYFGEFSKEFYFGNLFERVVWTIFFSIIMLSFCFVLYTAVSSFFGWELLPAISYKNIAEIMKVLHSEHIELPDNNTFRKNYADFVVLLSALYFMSALLGWVTHYLAKIFNYNFYNYWHFLIKGKKHRSNLKNIKYSRTTADILTDIQGEPVLYSGTIKDYHLTKNDTNLETIILSDVVKRPVGNSEKMVSGDNFCIHKDKILNMNLNYIYIETKQKELSFKIFQNIISIGYIISLIILLVIIYVNDEKLAFLNNWAKKITFFVVNSLILSFVFDSLKSWKFPKKEDWVVLLFFSGIAFWIYLNISFWWLICFFLTIILISTLINTKNKKQK